MELTVLECDENDVNDESGDCLSDESFVGDNENDYEELSSLVGNDDEGISLLFGRMVSELKSNCFGVDSSAIFVESEVRVRIFCLMDRFGLGGETCRALGI